MLDEAKKAHDANHADLEASQQYVSRLEKKLLLRGELKPENRLMKSHVDFQEPVPPGRRKKRKKRGPLTAAEKVEIVHQVLVGHEKQ